MILTPRATLLILFLISSALPCAALKSEWPSVRGPAHDGISSEQLALRSWPAEGPPQVWKIDTPTGFSSFAVAGGKAFTLVGREAGGGQREVCVAFDADTGKELWSQPLGPAKYDGGGDAGTDDNKGGDGPRSTPVHVDGRVYVLDAHLNLACLAADSGESLWQHDLVADYGGKLIRWQNAASPLVQDGRVFVAGGGAGQSLLAFDALSGELLWKTLDEQMTHATPTFATIHGVPQVIFYVQAGLVALNPESGQLIWRTEYPYRTSSAASPVVFEDAIYVSAGYGVGAASFAIIEEGDGLAAEFLWRKPNRLMNHWSTPICKDGYLYGMFSFKKYGEGPLMCVELATGETKWSEDGFGPGNVILVGDDLVALADDGRVVVVEATPEAYREVASAQVLDGKCWSTPAFSDGRLYLRSTEEGVCLDLSGSGQ